MSANQLALVVFTVLVAPALASEKNINVVVESMVYCQTCAQAKSWNVSYDKPINGATVSILCKDDEYGVNYYDTFETKNGHLYAELKGFKIGKEELDVPINACYVRVVSSHNVYCGFPTNVNYGYHDAPLRLLNKTISYGNRYVAEIYAAGPLAFRPATCTTPPSPKS